MNIENGKTSKPHKYILNEAQTQDLRSSNKNVALQNLSIYYIWKNVRQQYKDSIFKITAPASNDDFPSHDGSDSMSDIDSYIEFFMKKHQ